MPSSIRTRTVPFPFLHVDTTFKFQEMYEFRARFAKENNINLLVHVNQEGKKANMNPFDHGSNKYTAIMAYGSASVDAGGYDAAFAAPGRGGEITSERRVYSF